MSANTVNVADSASDIVGDTTPQLGGNLDVNGKSIVSVSNGNISITPNGSGKVILDGLNHPTADGSANQVLKTDGSGIYCDRDGGKKFVIYSPSSEISLFLALSDMQLKDI